MMLRVTIRLLPLLAAASVASQEILTAVSTPTYALVHDGKAVYQDYSASTAYITEITLDTKAKRTLLPQTGGGAPPYHYEYFWSGEDLVFVPFTSAAAYPLNYRNTTTGATRQVTTSQEWKETVWVGGGIVVWADYRHKTSSNQNSEIYMAGAASGTEQRITNDTRYQTKPVTDGHRIAWLDYVASDHANVVLYDISTATTVTLSPSARHQDNPRIDGDYVIWEDYRNTDADSTNADIYAYYIPTGQVIPVCTAAGFQGNPFLQGTVAVWDDYRNLSAGPDNSDLYGRNLMTGVEFPISTRIGYEASPIHYGNRVVWFQIDGSAMNLYAGILPTGGSPVRFRHDGASGAGGASTRFYRLNGRIIESSPKEENPASPSDARAPNNICRDCVTSP